MLFATLDPTLRAIEAAAWRHDHPVRHGRLHLRPADDARRRLPRHAGGGDRGRRASCMSATSRMATREAQAERRRRESCASSASSPSRTRPDHRGLEQGRPARGRRANARSRPSAARREGKPAGPGLGRDRRGGRHPPRADRGAPCARPAVAILVILEPADGSELNWLYEQAEILERRTDQEGRTLASVRIAPEKEPRFLQRFPGARRLPSRV